MTTENRFSNIAHYVDAAMTLIDKCDTSGIEAIQLLLKAALNEARQAQSIDRGDFDGADGFGGCAEHFDDQTLPF